MYNDAQLGPQQANVVAADAAAPEDSVLLRGIEREESFVAPGQHAVGKRGRLYNGGPTHSPAH